MSASVALLLLDLTSYCLVMQLLANTVASFAVQSPLGFYAIFSLPTSGAHALCKNASNSMDTNRLGFCIIIIPAWSIFAAYSAACNDR
jgi:hypothetical protein